MFVKRIIELLVGGPIWYPAQKHGWKIIPVTTTNTCKPSSPKLGVQSASSGTEKATNGNEITNTAEIAENTVPYGLIDLPSIEVKIALKPVHTVENNARHTPTILLASHSSSSSPPKMKGG